MILNHGEDLAKTRCKQPHNAIVCGSSSASRTPRESETKGGSQNLDETDSLRDPLAAPAAERAERAKDAVPREQTRCALQALSCQPCAAKRQRIRPMTRIAAASEQIARQKKLPRLANPSRTTRPSYASGFKKKKNRTNPSSHVPLPL